MEIIHQQSVDLERVANLCEIGVERSQPEPRNRDLWHVSSLLKASRSIIKGKVAYSDSGPAEMPSIAAMGRIWETAMDCYMADYAKREMGGYFQPDVVLEEDGICGSLDGMLLGVEEGMVYECKLRFTLNLEIPLDHQRQTRAYCHLAGVDTVCYASGHISTTPPVVQAVLRIIRFTQMSIEENWQGIVNTKRYLESLGMGPTSDANLTVSGNGRVPKVLNKKTDDVPADAVYVGRPSKWGNPYRVGETYGGVHMTREAAIESYKSYLLGNRHLLEQVSELRGKDLVCWCAPEPCHADVLLEIANK